MLAKHIVCENDLVRYSDSDVKHELFIIQNTKIDFNLYKYLPSELVLEHPQLLC